MSSDRNGVQGGDGARKGLFLDRDGTIIVHRPYLSNPDEVELVPGVAGALRHAIEDGYLLFLFTNQSGVGRGFFTLRDVEACNSQMFALLDLPAPGFSGICVAPEAPDAPPLYRKPSPRFILETITHFGLTPERCWMIGDSISDVQAGRNAGIRSILLADEPVENLPPGSEHVRNWAELSTALRSDTAARTGA